jgi:hypothetical protein
MNAQCTVFAESEVVSLENEINEWIRGSGAQVVSITGNIAPQTKDTASDAPALGHGPYAPSDVLVVVLYETGA